MASSFLTRTAVAAVSLVALRSTLTRPGRRPRRDEDDLGRRPTEAPDTPVRYGSLLVVILAALLFVAGAGLTIVLAPYGFVSDVDDQLPQRAAFVTNTAGDASRGRAAILAYGCRACHAVPGLPTLADHGVGPPLTDFAERRYIAGVMPNRPANLVAWLQDPPAFAPLTAMPDMGIDRATALDIARYLYAEGR